VASAYLDPDELAGLGCAYVGRGVRVHRLANLVAPDRLSIGDHSRIDAFVTVSAAGGVEIGRYVHIAGYCYLSGGAGIQMADFSGLSSHVAVYSTSDDYSGAAMTNPTVPDDLLNVTRAPVRIGRHVIVGSHSVVLPGVDIGDSAAVGALSLVAHSLAPCGIYSGVPARWRRARRLEHLDLEQRLAARDAGAGADPHGA
jgi:galactoside O-acetyltransferase